MAQTDEEDGCSESTAAESDDYDLLPNRDKPRIGIPAKYYTNCHNAASREVVSDIILHADICWLDKILNLHALAVPILSDLLLAKIREHGELKLDVLERIKFFTPKNGDRYYKTGSTRFLRRKLTTRNVQKYYKLMEKSQTKAMEECLAAESEKDNGELEGGMDSDDEVHDDSNNEMENEIDRDETDEEEFSDDSSESEDIDDNDEDDDEIYAKKPTRISITKCLLFFETFANRLSYSSDVPYFKHLAENAMFISQNCCFYQQQITIEHMTCLFNDFYKQSCSFVLNPSEPKIKFKKVISIHKKTLKVFPPMGQFTFRTNRVNAKQYVNTDVLSINLEHLMKKVVFGKAAPSKIFEVKIVDKEPENDEIDETTAPFLWDAFIRGPRMQYIPSHSPPCDIH